MKKIKNMLPFDKWRELVSFIVKAPIGEEDLKRAYGFRKSPMKAADDFNLEITYKLRQSCPTCNGSGYILQPTETPVSGETPTTPPNPSPPTQN